MLDYIKNFNHPKIDSNFKCSMSIFRPVVSGVVHSDDFHVDASNFSAYKADNLIASGVDVNKSAPFDDVSLNALDGVEEQSMRILESESITIKSNDNETKN